MGQRNNLAQFSLWNSPIMVAHMVYTAQLYRGGFNQAATHYMK